jgi:S1-C subfamily serine protease
VNRRRVLEGAGLAFLAGIYPAQSQAAIIDEDTALDVFDKASKSVVSIIDYSIRGGTEVQDGLGSGFIWDSYGHIVTNYHVIGRLVLDKSGSKASGTMAPWHLKGGCTADASCDLVS